MIEMQILSLSRVNGALMRPLVGWWWGEHGVESPGLSTEGSSADIASVLHATVLGNVFFLFFFFFFSPHTWGMQKFLGQGLNLRCSIHLSHSGESAGYLTR